MSADRQTEKDDKIIELRGKQLWLFGKFSYQYCLKCLFFVAGIVTKSVNEFS